jgi:hypothetical protein
MADCDHIRVWLIAEMAGFDEQVRAPEIIIIMGCPTFKLVAVKHGEFLSSVRNIYCIFCNKSLYFKV